MYSTNTTKGYISFENSVIKNIVGIAVSSSYGVVEMSSVKRIRDYIYSNVDKNYFEQGVVIRDYEHGVIDLDVHIVIGYSIPVKGLALEIKKRIAYELEKNLNIKVRSIVIYIDAIDKIG